jgi:RND family efflux transporter MFP subunit
LALLALTLGAFFWMKSQGAADELARAVAVNALVIGQVFYLLNSRYKTESSFSIRAHLGNRYLPLGVGAVVLLQILFTYAPPVQRLFGTASVPSYVWPRLFLGGFLFFLVVEAEKFVIRLRRSFLGGSSAIGSSGQPLPLAMNAAPPSASGRIRGASWSAWQGLIGALAVLGLVGGEVYSFLRQRDGDGYIAQVAERSAMAHSISATGTIDIQTKALKALVSGKIEKLHCEPGAKVQAGQLCASIDPRPYQVALDHQKSVLAAAQLQRDRDAAALARAKSEFEHKQTLVGPSAVSRAALARSRSDVERTRMEAEASEAALTRSQAAFEAAKSNLGLTAVLSPTDGTVLSRGAEIGKWVDLGKEQPLFVIAPDSAVPRISASVNAKELGNIKTGDSASFTVEEIPGRVFSGTVRDVDHSPRPPHDVGSYEVIITAPNSDISFAPGMRAHVTIQIGESQGRGAKVDEDRGEPQ